ncbi:MAG TPA: rRNA maturation RNase YbeY [Candidatus Polarisedimenticolaceae bacterium]
MSGALDVAVVNRQRARRVATAPLRRFLLRLSREAPAAAGSTLGVALVSDVAMRRFNREYRGKDRTTDVLSFPDGDDGHLGDVVISVPQAARQARERGHVLSRELRVLLVHGWLHLLGHDHETDDGTMMRLQRRLVRRLVDRAGAR